MTQLRVTAATVLAVAAGGAVGGALRFGLSAVASAHLLWVTLVINAVGCACLALLPALAVVRRSHLLTGALGPGLLGGFTTLSAYADQGRALVAAGRPGVALGYWLSTVVACVLGVLIARRVTSSAERVRRTAGDGAQ